MESGLLLCDIGNTALKTGFARNRKIVGSWSFPVPGDATPDSLGFTLLALLDHAGIDRKSLNACVAASVVPSLDLVLKAAAARYLGCQVLFVPADLSVPLANHYRQPAEVGADRLVGAYAARQRLPEAKSLIVVDYGTAVTFDCITDQAYLGGLIFPGPATAAAGLAARTAKLPHVNLEIDCPEPGPGLDTATSIRHGLVFGYLCLTEGLCQKLARQLAPPVKIIATGGFAARISSLTDVFDLVVPDLVLEGLDQLYNNA